MTLLPRPTWRNLVLLLVISLFSRCLATKRASVEEDNLEQQGFLRHRTLTANGGDRRHLQGQTTHKTFESTGHTVWQSSYSSGCSSGDHSIQIDVDADPTTLSDASVIITAYDVDFVDSTGSCSGGPEVDVVTLNGSNLGYLQGANNAQSVTRFNVQSSNVVQGINNILVDTDATGTGCWCVNILYVQIRALIGPCW